MCTEEFYIKPNRLKRGWGKYCSKRCNYEAQRTGSLVACHTCRKEIYKNLKDQKRSKSGNYFCNKSCQTVWRNSIYTGVKHPNWAGGTSSYRAILRRTERPRFCARCKSSDIRILTVHHKDKNRQNNSVPNLIWLCHNCHYLVHRYKSEAKDFVVPVAQSVRAPGCGPGGREFNSLQVPQTEL